MQSALDFLFERAVAAKRRRTYWRLGEDLQQIGSAKICTGACGYVRTNGGRKRGVGADVLGELGFEQAPRPLREKSLPPLKTALRHETDSLAVEAIVVALCRLNARSAIQS